MGLTGAPGPTGPAGTGATGFQRVVGAATANDGTATKTATASCPAGKVAVGGGYLASTVAADQGELTVWANRPTSDTVWSVSAAVDSGPSIVWSLQAFVVCLTQ